ncbi:MAG: sulfite exporter TauE/SafE family protein [Candidatus Thiodiazotropha sp. 6PLUC9]
MNSEFTLSLAFMTGILGSFHCLGMCSGINAGFFINQAPRYRISSLFAFHGMRIAVYTMLGVAGALVGQVLVQSGIVGKAQGILMIVAGVLILLLGLNMLGIPLWKINPGKPAVVAVPVATLSNSSSLVTAMTAGTLNGLVPCSLVFSVAVKALSTADPLQAGLLMMSFGAGTLPSMVVVTLSGVYVGSVFRGRLAKMAGLVVLLLGFWTLYEGVIFFDIMRGLANW